jgi:hypothetical protein
MMTEEIKFDWSTVPISSDKLVYEHTFAIPPTEKAIVCGEGGRMLAEIDNAGNVTYAADLTLDEAKFAIKIVLEQIVKGQIK